MGALVVWFIGLGALIGYVLITRGHLWMLPASLIVAAGLLLLDRAETPKAVGPAWAGLFHKHRGGFAVGILALIIAATSGLSLFAYFVGDDFAYLHYYHVLSWSNVAGTFHTDLAKLLWGVPGDELRPMYGLFFMLSYKLLGLAAPAYHLVSLLLHLANCLLIFGIGSELTSRDDGRSLLAAALFAVMPFNFIILPWITGAPAELLPTFFYLAGFLAFVRYRLRSSSAYAAISILAFGAGLLNKESAVTFPAMLFAYDVWRAIDTKPSTHSESESRSFEDLFKSSWVYAADGCLLGAYLLWRKMVLSGFLKEQFWTNVWLDESNAQAGHSVSLIHRIAAFVRYSANIEAIHLENLFIPFPMLLIAVAAGIYLFWAASFWRGRTACRASFGPIVFFGVVWYVITNVPLLAATPGVYHLYLPAAGTCIGVAFLAFPDGNGAPFISTRVRKLAFAAMLVLLGWQLGSKCAAEPGVGRLAEDQRLALQNAIQQSSPQSLTILWPGEQFPFMQEIYPHPLEPPFSPADLREERNIIADPILHCPHLIWSNEADFVLCRRLGVLSSPQVELNLLTWDARNHVIDSSRRTVPTQLLRAKTGEVCRDSAAAPPLTPAESEGVVRALAHLASDGR